MQNPGFCVKQLVSRQSRKSHRTQFKMGKSKVLKSFPRLQRAFQAAEDEELRDQFEVAMSVVGLRFGDNKPYKAEVKAADSSLKGLAEIAWQRLIVAPYAGEGTDPDIKKLLLHLKHGSIEQIEESLTELSESGKSGKPIATAWEVLKEIEAIHYSVFNASETAKRGAPPDLLSRGLGTCSCCFGEFHVKNDKMVRHGQRKVQDYMWSATCHGVAYPPLEISTKGLEEFILRYERGREQILAELKDPSSIKTVPVKSRDGVRTLTPEDPSFEKALGAHIVRLERDAKDMAADLEILRDRLDQWSRKLEGEPAGPKR